MSHNERQVVVFADARPTLASLVHNRLAEAGIESFVENEFLGQAAGDLPAGAIMPRVVVAEADAEDAHQVVADFRREAFGALAVISRESEDASSTAVARRAGPVADEDVAPAERVIVLCPECGKPRMTVCPYCNTASATFPAGDRTGLRAADDVPGLVICQTCDEPFEPEYYRRCAWCGHDFGHGRETEPPETVEYLNDRVTVAAVALGAAVFVVLAYFSTLLK
ncbi:MAG TPA: DUF2007 domain-containing protein [Pirellulales bacterium]|nr:DUF2007 domain-containing protein [Pirellulales bacterium]